MGDSVVPGLFLRVSDRGTKTWIVRRRLGNGGSIRHRLGEWPGITLAAARELARSSLAEFSAGKDPRRVKRENTTTFAAVVADFLERSGAAAKPSGYETRRLLTVEVLPEWGTRPIRSIERADVVALTDAIVDRGAGVLANRVAGVISRVFTFALRRGAVGAHPSVGLQPFAGEKSRARTLSDDELRKLWKALDDEPFFGPLVRLLILTGQRRGEVAAMKWSDLDLDAKVWHVPTPKGHRIAARRGGEELPAHKVPLCPMAAGVLAGVKRFEGVDYIFTATGDTAPSGFSKLATRLADVTGIEDATLHDIRRTVRTRLSGLDVTPDIAERVLGHVIRGVRGVYDQHDYIGAQRAALLKWEAAFAAILAKRGG